jgi:hypothetical protein
MQTHGRDKVLFGTNFPQLSWKRCVESVQRDLRLAPEVYERFMWRNACNVFGLDEPRAASSSTKTSDPIPDGHRSPRSGDREAAKL